MWRGEVMGNGDGLEEVEGGLLSLVYMFTLRTVL